MTKSIGQISLDRQLKSIQLSQHAKEREEQRLLILDKSGNLFISCVRQYNIDGPEYGMGCLIHKLGTNVETFSWNDYCDSVSFVADSKLLVCYYPNAPFVDIDFLRKTIETQEASNFGKKAEILSFCGDRLTLRKQDSNCIVYANLNQDASYLFQNATEKKWHESLRLCRLLDNSFLWGTLACLALQYDELETLEFTLCALKLVDKLENIRRIRSMKDGEVRCSLYS